MGISLSQIFLFADYSLEELANCPDAAEYGLLVTDLLWGHFAPVILAITAFTIIFAILRKTLEET